MKSEFKLTILIVTFNSSIFFETIVYVLDKLTYNKYKLLICDNSTSKKEKLEIKRIARKYENIEIFYLPSLPTQPSFQHGTSLDFLVRKVATPYTVVLDHDAVFLQKNWDQNLISELNSKVKIIGTQAPSNSNKFKDFPLMYAVLFDTKVFQDIKGTFMPIKPSSGLDTGHQLKDLYLSNGYKGKIFEFRSTREFKGGPFKDILCAEYYFNNKLIASHFMRGSIPSVKLNIRSPFRSKILSQIYYVFIWPLNRYLWWRDRKRWCEICKKMVKYI